MAKLDNFIPFVIKFETGISDNTNADLPSLYEKARKTGLAFDPDDRGGLTMVGVTFNTYKEYCRNNGLAVPTADNLRTLKYEEWHDILKTMFWNRWHADKITSQSVAEMLVDWVWASGSYGITIPQKALGVKVDGIVGPQTLEAVNSREPSALFSLLRQERIAYTERICRARPQNMKFRNGWLRRINSLPM